MYITCTDFKINEKILCLKYPLISENRILIPYYMSNNLEKLSFFLDFENSIELEKDWLILPINRPSKEIKDLLKVFDKIEKDDLNDFLRDYLKNLEGIYILDLEKTLLLIFKQFNKIFLKKLQKFLDLKNEDIHAILKIKETQEEMKLPYTKYHTKKFYLGLGKLINKTYLSITFNTMTEYLSFINKIKSK